MRTLRLSLVGTVIFTLLGTLGAVGVVAQAAGATHTVAPDGSGDFITISEAVAAAAAGDTVLVKPGEYREVVVIDKAITLQGDGPREGVVVAFPAGSGPNEKDPDGNAFYATLSVQGVDATIRGLTVSGAAPAGDEFSVTVLVVGGAPLLEDLSLVSEAPAEADLSIILAAGTAAVIRDSAWSGYLFADESPSPTIEGNTISTPNAILGLNGPAEVTVRGNTFLEGASISASGALTGLIEGNDLAGGTISVDTGSDMTVRGNTIHTAVTLGAPAIRVADSGTTAQVVGNTVTGMGVGVSVGAGAEATVEGNELTDDDIGISWSSMASGTIQSNTISGGVTGIVVTGGSPSIVDNTIEGASSRGISLGSLASPTISGNTVCGSAVNLYMSERADPELGENEICPDAPAE